jgi:AcrR family transcriptional regulator
VADASGLSKSSLFHHFRSKEQLYHEVILRMLLRIRERFEANVVPTTRRARSSSAGSKS